MGKFIDFDFSKRDVLDSFEFFVENVFHEKKRYYLNEIVNEFLLYMEKDIIEVYGKENLSQCKKYFKKILYDNEEYLYNKYNNERR